MQVQVLARIPAVGAAGSRLCAGLALGRAHWIQRQVKLMNKEIRYINIHGVILVGSMPDCDLG